MEQRKPKNSHSGTYKAQSWAKWMAALQSAHFTRHRMKEWGWGKEEEEEEEEGLCVSNTVLSSKTTSAEP